MRAAPSHSLRPCHGAPGRVGWEEAHASVRRCRRETSRRSRAAWSRQSSASCPNRTPVEPSSPRRIARCAGSEACPRASLRSTMAVAPQQVQEDPLATRLGRLARALEDRFLGKEEAIRLLVVAAIAAPHALLIGPPGTAKSALIRTFARLMDARYFEYLLTHFTEPNEIFGPVDIAAFREGRYERRTEGMLPAAEIVFLDEVFKSNSAILNALLTLLNERREP